LLYTGQEAPIDAQGFENALYAIDIGQNDVNGLLSNLPYDQVVAKFPPILAEIKDAVQVNFIFCFVVNIYITVPFHLQTRQTTTTL
jgi:hypothetical protein